MAFLNEELLDDAFDEEDEEDPDIRQDPIWSLNLKVLFIYFGSLIKNFSSFCLVKRCLFFLGLYNKVLFGI